MQKKVWAKPEINCVAFTANEYVSSCAETYNHFDISGMSLFIDNGKTAGTFDYYYGNSWSNSSVESSMDWATEIAGDNYYDTESYFNYIVDNRNHTSGYDQQIFFDNSRVNSTFDPCGGKGSVDLSGITVYDGWYYDKPNKQNGIFGQIKLWWDQRWHAATVSVNKS